VNRLALALLAAVSLAQPSQAAGPMETTNLALHTLTIRTYAVHEHDELSSATLTLASSLLGAAGVGSRWTSCGPAHADATCAQPLASMDLAIRLVHDSTNEPGRGPLPMGASLVDTTRRTGSLATLYLDRIDRLATGSATSADVILARAIAHEAAHLVLGTNEHGATGLMRPLWSRAMLRHGAASEWVFTEDEGRRLREALAIRLVAVQRGGS